MIWIALWFLMSVVFILGWACGTMFRDMNRYYTDAGQYDDEFYKRFKNCSYRMYKRFNIN
jgi:hypothetical protein